MKAHGLMFTALYQIPWIIRWDVVVSKRTFQKLGESLENIPYVGRRILIKWWDKFEFFKDSVLSVRGIIDLEPITPTKSTKSKKEISEVLTELFSSASKKDLKNQIKELLESSDDEDEEMMSQNTEHSDPMQDAQDPYQQHKGQLQRVHD
ncbi:hypothetical protein Salat_1447000 [Sesamum alatum]|uniref:Uncharacterized protein n=1 Tax=Sesamum alatum TaxID=300844 RepID=A0AAE2CLS4_9LAMI|nr:hypothetical protein Salat_1447000 [Sesamum alatum]